ncbi:hypothetical protein M9979_08470 [Sphingomonas sp. RP10(2022)]|uniref:Uncharacterized protein n=1 Tax=Sphingomonas liriopis TaxID=2949094 RepID=A0A9X2HPR7_9SPHN|nr:hypothetical protein [Sphingomonas liriopis]MCP3734903.1 hypothetical protein [Sphingomonas liriopis]
MKHEADIASRTRRLPDAKDFARAKAMHAAGEGVEHIVVGQWLLTWGKPGRKDFEDWLQDQNG